MISGLPDVPARRLAVRLTPDAFRQVRGGHPWVYAEAITSVSDPTASPGTLAVIFDKDRNFAAIGLWDPASPIRIRVLHHGKPTAIDESFWRGRVADAHHVRRRLRSLGTTGYRLLHGENDGTGGLVVDVYGSTAVFKIYSSAWLPHLNALLVAVRDQIEPDRIVVRLGRLAQADPLVTNASLRDGMTVFGEQPDGPVLFRENDLTFEADVINGQKTGHFLDQRENRAYIQTVSNDAHVLDVFSCTGGFSVHAAAGGATAVHSVDIAAPAIDTAKRNMAHNQSAIGRVRHRATVGDAFEVMADLGRQGESYDVVIIDPPSFASRASERDGALRAYRKLTELGLPLVRPGGRLFQASCSSRVTEDDLLATIQAATRAQRRLLHDRQTMGHAIDHPIGFAQGTYLKAVTGLVGNA